MGDIALKKRSEVPAEYKWKLEDMFETDAKGRKIKVRKLPIPSNHICITDRKSVV